jgi:hypothetical protein
VIDLTPIEDWTRAKGLGLIIKGKANMGTEWTVEVHQNHSTPEGVREHKGARAIFLCVEGNEGRAGLSPDQAEALASELLVQAEYTRKVLNNNA